MEAPSADTSLAETIKLIPATPRPVHDDGIGVLSCCGKRLVWEPQEGTSVMEVTCPKCGTTYAMDRGEDEEDETPGDS